MLQGQASKANEVWATFLKSLQAWMDQNQTDPLIIASIIHGLNKRRYPTGSTTTCHTSTLLAEDQQLDIGWGIMLEGWLTIEWELKQKAYFALLNSRRSSRRWVIVQRRKLWLVAQDMWTQNILVSPNLPESRLGLP
jgi:hypothetical protein